MYGSNENYQIEMGKLEHKVSLYPTKHTIVENWSFRLHSNGNVEFYSRYSWKRNYTVHAYFMGDQVLYHNPKSVSIPNYVRSEVSRLLMFGGKFFSIVKLHRGFAMHLWLNMEETRKSERPNYDYDVQTPGFISGDNVYLDGINFKGDQFSPAPSILADKDQILDDLLLWLTLKSGDTDPSYFDSYTPEQLDWSNSLLCQEISCDLSD